MRGIIRATPKLALLILAFGPFALGQNRPEQNPPPAPPAPEIAKTGTDLAKSVPLAVDPKAYQIGAEDVLSVVVWREPDYSKVVAVRPDGKISLPMIGEVDAASQTPEQLGKRLAEKLAAFINNPQVTVSVESVRSKRYYITGEVSRTGAFPLAVPTTVLEALSQAGGFKDFANTKRITVLRGTKSFKFNYKEVVKGKNMSQNILLENGDYIIVP